MKTLSIPHSTRRRALEFIDEFYAAPRGTQIDLSVGVTESGEPAIVVNIAGRPHGFTSAEARELANTGEDAMQKFPDEPSNKALAHLIKMLRFGADKAEEIAGNMVPPGTSIH